MNGGDAERRLRGVVRPALTATTVVPFVDEGLGNSSYLIEVGEGRALVVDPSRDPLPYLREAEARHLELAWVAETHLHADFVSGSGELAQEGATVLAARVAGLGFAHQGLEDGEDVDLGGFRIRAVATPGHTPEHLSFVLFDGSTPIGVFTGGALLPGGAARTDLISPDQTEPLARALYRSVRSGLLALPDETLVYPTHGSGSFCSTPAGGDRITTIGRERAENPLFKSPDEDTFVQELLGSFGTYPTYFLRLRDVNRHGPTLYGRNPPVLPALGPQEVQALLAAGADLIDVRPIEDFAATHVPGGLSIELRPAFASWLGWLVPPGRSLVFVLNDDQDRSDLVEQCLKVGYEDLAGELGGGMTRWAAAGLEVSRIALEPAVASDARILDVRQDSEFASGHVPGAVHVELGTLPGTADLPLGALTVMCSHGQRAMSGASLLERSGHRDLSVLRGGPADWSDTTGRPLERS
jgi:hydroxyacylglutathione hydrolase